MKVRVDVADLKPGMFVSELDRPWTETSFMLEGVLIDGGEELEELRSKCQYVFVDSEKSQVEVSSLVTFTPQRPHTRAGHTATLVELQKEQVEADQRSFQQELVAARKIHHRTRSYIDQCLEDVRLGRSVDTKAAREIVSDMADSITRSPTALMWLSHMKERDEYTSVHSMNVCILSLSFGRCLGLSRPELEVLGLGALLHDLGKMRIPLEILNKPGRLSKEEFDVIKTHPVIGHEIVSEKGDVPKEALDIILFHHERRNGSGYPQGLNGDHISNLTRIVAIVDVYDAITSDRCYHDAITPYDALKNMYEWINESFDKDIIEQFIKCLGIYPIGSVVELNRGNVGIVVSASEKSRLRPIVLMIQDSKGQRYDIPKLINLAHPRWLEKGKQLDIKRILSKNEYEFNIKQLIADEKLI